MITECLCRRMRRYRVFIALTLGHRLGALRGGEGCFGRRKWIPSHLLCALHSPLATLAMPSIPLRGGATGDQRRSSFHGRSRLTFPVVRRSSLFRPPAHSFIGTAMANNASEWACAVTQCLAAPAAFLISAQLNPRKWES